MGNSVCLDEGSRVKDGGLWIRDLVLTLWNYEVILGELQVSVSQLLEEST